MVRPERFELPTYCSGGNRSIHLSYGRLASVYMRGDRSINVGVRSGGNPIEAAMSTSYHRSARAVALAVAPSEREFLTSGLAHRRHRRGRHGLRRDLHRALRGRVRRLRRARFWGGPRLR